MNINTTFSDWWKHAPEEDRQKARTHIAKKSFRSEYTVASWGYGKRSPKAKVQEIVVRYFKSLNISVTRESLFPTN